MSITKNKADVYYSSSKRRRYFTLKAAVKAEANARIFEKFPTERAWYGTNGGLEDAGYFFPTVEPERYAKLLNRLCRIIRRQFRNSLKDI